MLKFKFDKLVRDKIVDHQIASGAKPKYHRLNDYEHKKELIKKIKEEAQEILQASPEDAAAEIADVQQAVDDLIEKFGLTSVDVAREQRLKNDKSGAFKNGLFVDYVEVNPDDKWVEYYRKNSDRYPELS